MPTGIVDQYPAHELRGNPEEMTAVLPLLLLIDQLQIGLVDQGGGLQSMVRTLMPQISSSHAAQFLVKQRDQLIGGVIVASLHALKQQSHIFRVRLHCAASWNSRTKLYSGLGPLMNPHSSKLVPFQTQLPRSRDRSS